LGSGRRERDIVDCAVSFNDDLDLSWRAYRSTFLFAMSSSGRRIHSRRSGLDLRRCRILISDNLLNGEPSPEPERFRYAVEKAH
jgi:hypothetical protein